MLERCSRAIAQQHHIASHTCTVQLHEHGHTRAQHVKTPRTAEASVDDTNVREEAGTEVAVELRAPEAVSVISSQRMGELLGATR